MPPGNVPTLPPWAANPRGTADLSPGATAEAAALAIGRARQAFTVHRTTTVGERLAALRQLGAKIRVERELIIDRVMAEVGKCRTDALIAEILGSLDWLAWLERHAEKILASEKVPTPITLLGKRSKLYHEPIGVALVICPWNYPFHNAITAIAAAIAAGNAVVYKPSEHAPCQGLVEGLLQDLGLLSDLTTVVYGDGQLGAALIDARPDKVFFTGSGVTGARIMERASRQLIPVELELGGKDAMLVFADAATDRAAMGALWGAFTNAGQSCSAVERLLVEERVVETFTCRLVELCQGLVTSQSSQSSQPSRSSRSSQPPLDPDGHLDMGRMTVAFQRQIVQEHIDDALAKGARLRCGRRPGGDDLDLPPIVLDQVTTDMRVWREETFGPVLPVMAFRDEAEALALANDSPYGLCASIFTHDQRLIERLIKGLDVGGISVNNVNMSEGNPGLPFGGCKQSGFGRLRGPEGLLGFTRSKAVLIDGGSPEKIEANWYPYTPEKYRRFGAFLDALYRPGPWRLLRLARIALHGLRLEAFSQKPRREVSPTADLAAANLYPGGAAKSR